MNYFPQTTSEGINVLLILSVRRGTVLCLGVAGGPVGMDNVKEVGELCTIF